MNNHFISFTHQAINPPFASPCSRSASDANAGAFPRRLIGVVSPLEGWLLVVMQSHYPDIRPSIRQLSQESGIGRSTVIKLLSDMEKKGWITKSPIYGADRGRKNNAYTLNIWEAMRGGKKSSGMAELTTQNNGASA